MKKFKLIKTYPGSPALGEIRVGSEFNERFNLTEKCMESNPEFWEEVVGGEVKSRENDLSTL